MAEDVLFREQLYLGPLSSTGKPSEGVGGVREGTQTPFLACFLFLHLSEWVQTLQASFSPSPWALLFTFLFPSLLPFISASISQRGGCGETCQLCLRCTGQPEHRWGARCPWASCTPAACQAGHWQTRSLVRAPPAVSWVAQAGYLPRFLPQHL